jgi:AraC-like DNA-binding protein
MTQNLSDGARISTAGLARLVEKIAYSDGDFKTAIPALMAYRRSSATDPMPTVYGLGLALTVQGEKRATLGNEIFTYAPGQSLVTSLDLPVIAHITDANASEPYLGLCLALDAQVIAQVAEETKITYADAEQSPRALSVVALDEGLLDAITRLVNLLDEPEFIPQLAPLIQREIAVRLLRGEHASTLRHLVLLGSNCQRIAKSVSWLKQNFIQSVSIDELAAKVHMSPSTFRQHFKYVAGMSPLQYIKHLRLQEARQIMLNDHLDAGSAAMRVGYESASQFSREYSRLFGQPPHRDMKLVKGSKIKPSFYF